MFLSHNDFADDDAGQEAPVQSRHVNALNPSYSVGSELNAARVGNSDVGTSAGAEVVMDPMPRMSVAGGNTGYNESIQNQNMPPNSVESEAQSRPATAADRRARLAERQKQEMQKRKSKLTGTTMVSKTNLGVGDGGDAQASMQNFEAKAATGRHGSAGSSSGGAPDAAKDMSSFSGTRDHQDYTLPSSATAKELAAQGMSLSYDPLAASSLTQAAPEESKLDLSNIRAFINSPAPKGTVIQCTIVRAKDTAKKKAFPTYELYLTHDGEDFLLASKKRSMKKTSNYVISEDSEDLKREGNGFCAKLRSNVWGTEFTCYDKGLNPGKLNSAAAAANPSAVRQELVSVLYAPNITGGPRKMVVLVPRVGVSGSPVVFRPLKSSDSGIIEEYRKDHHSDLTILVNKAPQWNEQIHAYVLNFNGRVTMASVKNFQLVSIENDEDVILQFGRVSADRFSMDLTYPLSPLQAFGVCLSSFDSKLACE